MEAQQVVIKGRVLYANENEIFQNSDISKNKNVIGFFIDYSEHNIPLKSRFTKLIINNEIINIDWKLVYITDNSFFSLDFIEEGYKTICLFEINEQKNIVSRIPITDDWYNEKEEIYKLEITDEKEQPQVNHTEIISL